MGDTLVIHHVLTEEDELFLHFMVGGDSDLFMNACLGYWCQGVAYDEHRGWLVYEFGEEDRYAECIQKEADAMRIWDSSFLQDLANAGGMPAPLPENFYRLDRAAALKALALGIERWGENFSNGQCDYSDYDWTIQKVLLGEIRYG